MFTTEVSSLLNATKAALGISQRVSITPILSCLFLEAFGDSYSIAATDGQDFVRAQASAECNVESHLSICVPAKTFHDVLSGFPKTSTVKIQQENGNIVIECDGCSYSIQCLPAQDFPQLASFGVKYSGKLDAKKFGAALSGVMYALPTKDHRRILMGVNIAGGWVTATDGKQLSREPIVGIPEAVTSLTIDGTFLRQICSVMNDYDEFTLSTSEDFNSVQFDFASSDLTLKYVTRCIEGKYPDCNAVIPKDHVGKLTVSAKALSSTFKRAKVTSDMNQSVRLRLSESECLVSSSATEVGKFQEKFKGVYEGEPIEVCFNAQLFIETLNTIPSDECILFIKSNNSPVKITSVGMEGLRVAMPIKIAEVKAAQHVEE
jgi:DNA polymerase-3 subunit beta